MEEDKLEQMIKWNDRYGYTKKEIAVGCYLAIIYDFDGDVIIDFEELTSSGEYGYLIIVDK